MHQLKLKFKHVVVTRFVELSHEYEMEFKPTPKELIDTLENAEDISKLITKPGQRFRGPGGSDVAATKIQATWRRFTARKSYLAYRRKR